MIHRRALLKILSLSGIGLSLDTLLPSWALKLSLNTQPLVNDGEKPVYLMAHFLNTDQNLYYAISENARDWTPLNKGKPILIPDVDLRDPFINRGPDGFHLVHTQGWDHPNIYHYYSKDLVHWEGGPIKVVSDDLKRAWAPEWIYDQDEQIYYIFWASEYKGHNAIYFTKTKNWKDIDPDKAKVYYDLGIDDIDLTIIKNGNYYYGFHKPGSLEANLSIEMMQSPTLDPHKKDFSFGKGPRRAITNEEVKPIEGPEITKITGQQKWYLYADPFHQPFIAWETTDFKQFKRIPVTVPKGSKHCSLLAISQKERQQLLQSFPI